MKKLLIVSLTLLSVSITSCGDDKEDEEKKETTACSCVEMFEKAEKEMKDGGDFKEIEQKYAEDIKACDKLQDEMGGDKFREEMLNCK